jgi:hypothetical protein
MNYLTLLVNLFDSYFHLEINFLLIWLNNLIFGLLIRPEWAFFVNGHL